MGSVEQTEQIDRGGSGGGRHRFVTTCWTQVLQAAGCRSPERTAGFERLFEQYRSPIYGFLRRRGLNHEDAEDAIQMFFERLISTNRLAGLKREGGKFRSFLLASLTRFLTDEWRRNSALKRGAGLKPLPLEQLEEGAATEGVDSQYDREWAETVLERAKDRLREKYRGENRLEVFETLKAVLLEQGERRYSEIAAQLDSSEEAVRTAIHRLRRRFGRAIREEIGRTVSHPEDVGDELRHLLRALAG
jgi:RNA polymerase sigma factor (sigma-70 family)